VKTAIKNTLKAIAKGCTRAIYFLALISLFVGTLTISLLIVLVVISALAPILLISTIGLALVWAKDVSTISDCAQNFRENIRRLNEKKYSSTTNQN